MIEWIGFFVSVAILLIGSRYHLGLSLFTGAIILGLFTLSPTNLLDQIWITFTDISVIILTLALSLIPIISGILQDSGELDHIVENLRVGKRGFLGLSPAVLGLLPVPGGALFSAPLIDRASQNLENHNKAGINIWFRHILFFIYPLAPALIIPTNIANIPIHTAIRYLFPFFLLSLGIGYIFLLRKSKGSMDYDKDFSPKRLVPPLTVILAAPILDYSVQKIFQFQIKEISTFVAIFTSLSLAIYFVDSRRELIKESVKKSEPWNFAMIILGIFVFINVFKASGVGDLIASLSPSRMVLSIVFAFFLGLATGRINLPASIIIPTYLVTYSLDSLPPLVFAVMYFSIFMGYVLSPVHPCVGLSLKYFDAENSKFLKSMVLPVGLSMLVVFLVFLLYI